MAKERNEKSTENCVKTLSTLQTMVDEMEVSQAPQMLAGIDVSAINEQKDIQADLEENCIYVLEEKFVNATTRGQGSSAYVTLQNLKWSTPTFEMLAAGIYTLLPFSLGISIDEIKYSHGIKIDKTTARAFARFEFRPEFFRNVLIEEFKKQVQMCIDILKDKHLWNNEKMKEEPICQTPGFLEQAREVRGQFGSCELPGSCILTGFNLSDPIKIDKQFGVPKPVKVEVIDMVRNGEVKGFHGEFHLLHFVFGSHRKVVDIGFDEEKFKHDIVKFSTIDKIVVEAKWMERREDGVVRSMTLTGLRLIQEPLFDMPK